MKRENPEKTEKIGICMHCGNQFVKKSNVHKCCSKVCIDAYCRKTARAMAKGEIPLPASDCPHSKGIVCINKKCDTCGWNPEVAKRRLAML